jgi:hypothetical protein
MGNNGFARIVKFWDVLLILLVMASPVLAQSTGSILGTVKDSSGATVSGATVTVQNMDTGTKRTTMTGDDGTYNVPNLEPGHYQVQALLTGFKTATRTGLNLEVTQSAVLNFALEVGATTERVVVSTEASVVNTQDATLGGLVTETAIKDLPLNGRNYINLSLLQPGVVESKNIFYGGGFGTAFSSNGASTRSNNFTLDGAIMQSQFSYNPGSEGGNTLGIEGIKEYRVITNNFDAQYGVTMGSQTVMVSSSGTNSFHGDAFEFIRNAAMDAKQFFDLSPKIPQFQKNNFGGSLGGPIKREKTFFFGVYEGLRQNVGVTELLNVPSAGCHPPASAPANATLWNGVGTRPAGSFGPCPDLGTNPADPTQPFTGQISPDMAPFLALFSSPNLPPPAAGQPPQFTFPGADRQREDYGQMRVDQNFSTSDNAFVRYTIDNFSFTNATVGVAPSVTGNNYPYFGLVGVSRNQYLTLGETHIFTPTVLNTVQISFSRTNLIARDHFQNFPSGGPAGGPPIIPNGVVTAGGASPIHPTGIVGINGYAGWSDSSSYPVQSNTQNIYTLGDDVIVTRGKHSLKFGTLLNRWNQGQIGGQGVNGALSFASFDGFIASTPTSVSFQTPVSIIAVDYLYNTYGFYAQDDWHVTPRLTLNLGLRYEFSNTPHELDGNSGRIINLAGGGPSSVGPPMQNSSLHNFSPRIGLAWDVFGNGRTAVRSGFGIYYDVGNTGTILQQLFVPPVAAKSNLTLDGNTFVQVPLTASVLASPPGSQQPVAADYHSKQPYLEQYNLSVQQQLPLNIGLTVAYAGSRGIHLWTLKEGNPIHPTSTGPCGNPASRCVPGVGVQFWDTGSPAYLRPNPNFPTVILITTAGDSWYNALEVSLTKRLSHGLEFQAGYTNALVTDTTQGMAYGSDCTNNLQQASDPLHSIVDKGPACFDVRNVWHFSTLYHIPTVQLKNAFLSKAVNGWWLSTIVSLQGGYPFAPHLGFNRSESGNVNAQSDYVNINTAALIAANPCTSQPGQPPAGANPCAYTPIPFNPATVYTGNINQWFNPAMFSMSPASVSPEGGGNFVGQLGTLGRDSLRGPNFRNWDFSLVKDTKVKFLGEAGSVQFRAEIFNILNHPNFDMPNPNTFDGTIFGNTLGPFSASPNGTAGQITGVIGSPRQIQLALKVIF